MLQYLGKFSGMNPLDLHTIAVYTYPEEREKIEATASSTNSDPSKKNRKWVKLLRNGKTLLEMLIDIITALENRHLIHTPIRSIEQHNNLVETWPAKDEQWRANFLAQQKLTVYEAVKVCCHCCCTSIVTVIQCISQPCGHLCNPKTLYIHSCCKVDLAASRHLAIAKAVPSMCLVKH